MADHWVEVKAPRLELGKVDMVFRVKRDGIAHGRLKISKGGVEWMQRSDSKKAFHLDWNRLDQIFSRYGTEGTTRSKGKRRRNSSEVRPPLIT